MFSSSNKKTKTTWHGINGVLSSSLISIESQENVDLIDNMMNRGGAGNGLDIKLMHPYDYKVYSARRGGKSRILLIEIEVGGEKYAYLLEEDPEHDQREKSVYLKQKDAVDIHLQKSEIIKSIQEQVKEIIHAQNSNNSSTSQYTTFQPTKEYLPKHIKSEWLSEEQAEAILKSTPCIYRGGPGTGKTVAMLEWLYRQAKYGKKALYLTKNDNLKKQEEQEYQEKHPDFPIRFATYKELLEEQESKTTNPRQAMSEKSYRDFLKKYNFTLGLTVEELERELRVCSGYSEAEYVGLQGYAGLGVRQSNYGGEENKSKRSAIYDVKKHLITYLEKYHLFHENFTELKCDQQYEAVGYDEAHDGSLLQLKSVIVDLTENHNIVLNYDRNQKSYDQVDSKDEYLKKKIPSIIHRDMEEQQLKKEYRSAYWICELSNLIQCLINRRSVEQETYSQGDQEIDGDVQWLKVNEENKKEMKDLVGKSNDFIIITPEEYKADAKKEFGSGAVFTPEEYKGRGFKNVILYRFFDSKRWENTLKELNDMLEKLNVRDEKAIRLLLQEKKNRGQENKDIDFLKELLIAVSRGKEALLIYQKYHNKFKFVFEFLRCGKKELDKIAIENLDYTPSTAKDCYELASRLEDAGHQQQAKGKLRDYLIKKKYEEYGDTSGVPDEEVNKVYAELHASKPVKSTEKNSEKSSLTSNANNTLAIDIEDTGKKDKIKDEHTFKRNTKNTDHTSVSKKNNAINVINDNNINESYKTCLANKVAGTKKTKEKNKKTKNYQDTKNVVGPETDIKKIYLAGLLESFNDAQIAMQNLDNLFKKESDQYLRYLFEIPFFYHGKTQTLFAHLCEEDAKNTKKKIFENFYINRVYMKNFIIADANKNNTVKSEIDFTLFPNNLSTKSKPVHDGLKHFVNGINNLAFFMFERAIEVKNVFLAKLMIESIENLSKPTLNDMLYRAISCNCKELVDFLTKKGADKLNKIEKNDINNQVVICEMETLIKKGNTEILERIQQEFKEIPKDELNSNLIIAAKYGCEEVTKLLLQNNADVHYADEFKRTALHLAASKGHLGIVKELLHHSNINIDKPDMMNNTPLITAVGNGHEKIVDLLIEKHANVNHQGNLNRTALHWAADRGSVAMVTSLLTDEKIALNVVDVNQKIPLAIAKNPDVIKLLVSANQNTSMSSQNSLMNPMFFSTRQANHQSRESSNTSSAAPTQNISSNNSG